MATSLTISKGDVSDVNVTVNQTDVLVAGQQNISVEVTPAPRLEINVDYGMIGPQGPQGSQGDKGDTGQTGPKGDTGNAGAAATIAAGTTTTGAAGTSASVSNSGTSSAAIFNFTIPRGDKGDTGQNGTPGTAATVAAGTTTTGAAETSASVTNSGTSSAAVFNFTIPRGNTGATGPGVATGGTAGQVLSKINSTDYNTQWTSLGTMASQNANAVAITGGTESGVTHSGDIVGTYLDWTSTSAPSYTEGRLWYDSTQKSLAYYNDVTNNTLHVGQETQLKVYNNTGATISKGAPVYITSTTSGFSYPLVALAKADNQTTGAAIGLANQNISTATAGYVTISGLVNGLSLGSMTVGDTIYVSPYSAGQLMNTFPPTGYPVKIGVVAYANTPNGSIYVSQANAYVAASAVVGQVAVANGGTGASTASAALTNLGAYPAINPNGYTNNIGTVTSVGGTGTINGLTLTGTVTTSGNLTFGGTLDLSSPPAIGSTAANTGAFTTLSATSIDNTPIGGTTPAAGKFTTLIGGKDQANYAQITGGATTKAVEFIILGTDTNIAAVIKSKGTGAIDLAAGSSGVNISNGGAVTAITRTAGGTGYAVAPTVTISAPTTAGGVQATATCTVTAGVVDTTFAITNAGAGYVEQPMITFTPVSGGSGAAAYAMVGSGAVVKTLGQTVSFYTPQGEMLRLQDGANGQTGNYLQISQTTGNDVLLSAQGTSTSPSLYIGTKGTTGGIRFTANGTGTEQMRIVPTASAVNYVQVTGAATGNSTIISGQGSDASVNITFQAKGVSGALAFGNTTTINAHAFKVSTATASNTGNAIQITGAAAGSSPTISAVSNASGTDANIDLTLTPKGTGRVNITTSIKPKVNSAANVISPLAWDSTSYDEYAITALANALTINADANASPADGQKMIFRFKDNGTARALTWTASATNAFRVVGVTLPITTVANKLVYIGCIYNAADSRWDAVAVSQEA